MTLACNLSTDCSCQAQQSQQIHICIMKVLFFQAHMCVMVMKPDKAAQVTLSSFCGSQGLHEITTDPVYFTLQHRPDIQAKPVLCCWGFWRYNYFWWFCILWRLIVFPGRFSTCICTLILCLPSGRLHLGILKLILAYILACFVPDVLCLCHSIVAMSLRSSRTADRCSITQGRPGSSNHHVHPHSKQRCKPKILLSAVDQKLAFLL